MSTNSCTSPIPSVLIFPISRATSSPSASRCVVVLEERLKPESKACTFALRACRICWRIPPRRGAGTERRAVYASRVCAIASWNSAGVACKYRFNPWAVYVRVVAHTVVTLARTSPVVGQTLLTTSPVPCHRPSYKPGISSPEMGRSTAERTAAALEDN
jgi:hypothetical protein